jgi:hypothetical protein
MTVEELLERISSRELTEWAVFEQEYGPIGLERGDWQAALVVQATAGDGKSKLSDYLLRWGRKRRQTGQEQLAIFKAMASGGGETPSEHDREPPDPGRG